MSKPKTVKPFFKINFEDLEIAESFFENEKHFSEFLLAVSYYYRRKEYTIKQKFVQRYFNTYKKTMDFIIDSKKTGSDGGKQRVENQKIKEQTLERVVEAPVEPNNKLLNSNNKEESINNKLINYRAFAHLSISFSDFNKLIAEGFTKDQIDLTLNSVENFKGNKKYKSLYLTSLNWLKKNHPKASKPIEGETEEEKDLRIRIESFKKIKVH